MQIIFPNRIIKRIHASSDGAAIAVGLSDADEFPLRTRTLSLTRGRIVVGAGSRPLQTRQPPSTVEQSYAACLLLSTVFCP